MNVLINLSHLKIGGGQNVGLNFISTLKLINTDEFNFVFIAAKNSMIHNFLKENIKLFSSEISFSPKTIFAPFSHFFIY